jgi:hypothetical protein
VQPPRLGGHDERLNPKVIEDLKDGLGLAPYPFPFCRILRLLLRDVEVDHDLVGHAFVVHQVCPDPLLAVEVLLEKLRGEGLSDGQWFLGAHNAVSIIHPGEEILEKGDVYIGHRGLLAFCFSNTPRTTRSRSTGSWWC